MKPLTHPPQRRLTLSIVMALVAVLLAIPMARAENSQPAASMTFVVVIDNSAYVLSGQNVEREHNELVMYTRTDTATQTPTNKWGVEVVVRGNVVTAINDRQTTDAPPIEIPPGGFVLSGHYQARDWLTAHATIGARVLVVPLVSAQATTETDATQSPTKQPTATESARPGDEPLAVNTPKSIPSSVQPSGSSALPSRIVGGYVNMYQGPATAQLPNYNVLFAAFALGGGGQNMHFIPPAKESVEAFKAGIREAQSRGVKWILSIGGGVPQNEQTFIQNEDQATAVFNGLVPIINEYGFNGVDYDLENGPAGFTKDGLLTLSRKLKAKYGAGFAITMTPRPYENFAFDIAAAHSAEGMLDALQLQFYDDIRTRDDAYLASWIPSRLDAAHAAGVPYSKMVVGCITMPGYSMGWNDAETYRDIIRTMIATRGIGGAFVWDAAQEAASQNTFMSVAGSFWK